MSLHSKEIYLSEASYVPDGGRAMEASSMSFDLQLTTVKLTFPEALVKGKGILKLTFQCTINNQASQNAETGWEEGGSRGASGRMDK